jgi:hypothetical protein
MLAENDTIAPFRPMAGMVPAETDGFGPFVASHRLLSSILTNSHIFRHYTSSCAPVFLVKAGFFAFSGARSPYSLNLRMAA